MEFDYLLPTPFWYDAPTGGNLVAYGQSTLDPVAEGLANAGALGSTTLYVDCGLQSNACTGPRTAVDFQVLEVPEPAFTAPATGILAGEAVAFTYTGTAGISYLWDFGDGTSSTEMHPTHAWSMAGDYPITLTVDNGACEASTSSTVIVEVNTGVGGLLDAEGIRVFATADAFIIEPGAGHGPLRAEVLDALGRTVLSRALTGRTRIAADGLDNGVWLVRLSSSTGQRTFRVPLVR